jgi:hypothetical protein
VTSMTQNDFGRSPARSSARKMLGWTAAALLLAVAPARLGAQSTFLSDINPLGNSRDGLQLYSVSGFAGWESQVAPPGGYFPAYGPNLQGDETFGGGASLGWTRSRGQNNFSISYSANYVGQVRYSQLNALNQSLSLGWNRHLGRKWTLGFAAASGISNYDQMLFSPTVFSSVAGAPGSFDDLASAILAGKYNNNQLASLLTGAPVIESPARTYFFGNRVFGSSGSMSLAYQHSQRLSINFSASGTEAQHLKEDNVQGVSGKGYLIPRAVTAGAGLFVSYALTPRTQLGVSMTSGRGFSEIQQAYTTSGSLSLGRTLSQHWFASVSAGAGFTTYISSRSRGTIGSTPSGGVEIGYRARSHTLIASYGRTLGQAFGVGAADIYTTNAAWQWRQPGRTWGLSSSYMQQEMSNGIFGHVSGWRAGIGMGRQMGQHAVLDIEYMYAAYSGSSVSTPYNSTMNAVRLSVGWIPRGTERR